MKSLFKKFRSDILGVLWAGCALFLTLSLASFDAKDPSLSMMGLSLRPKNLCGYLGSFSSDFLLQIFGLSAWLFAVAAFRVSIQRFRSEESPTGWGRPFLSLGFIFTASSLLSLMFPQARIYHGTIRLGGGAGALISSSLMGVLNLAGVHILLWTLLLVFMVFYTEKSLIDLVRVGGVWRRLASSIVKLFDVPIARPLPAAQHSDSEKKSSLAGFFRKAFEYEPKDHKPIFELAKPEEPIGETFPLPERSEGRVSEHSPLILERADQSERTQKKIQITRKVENWDLPKISLLQSPPSNRIGVDQKVITRNIKILEDKLSQFSVNGEVTAVKPGPAVTMYEFKPKSDVKISKITELADDLALALSSESVRIIAPLPGRDVVGIETSNPLREAVFLREGLEDPKFWDQTVRLPMVLGKQADGASHVEDLRKMPHLLVAGSTGSGKSVFILSAITGLLFRHSPKTLRLILIDPKQVDLAAFHKIPHLLMPPIREGKKAVVSLKWAIREMDKRYRSMSKFDARGLEGFNEAVAKFSNEEIEKHKLANEEIENAARLESYYYTQQPYIVIVVEEFGDLMAVDKANVEQAVVRLAQMARASGIHLILAMQSPRKDVVTGLIKTNIPGRISFKVASKMDSRIILDESGAERLLAGGDMLFLAPGVSKPMRHQGAWIPESEVSSVARFWSDQAEPEFDKAAMRMLEGTGGGYDFSAESGDDGDEISESEFDEKYDEILAYVASQKEVSASLLQRRFHLGYPRAARMIEIFEKEGVVGPANGSKPRQVMVRSHAP